LIYITDRIGGGLYILEYTGRRPIEAREKARSLSESGIKTFAPTFDDRA
jgi:hypothetical protein